MAAVRFVKGLAVVIAAVAVLAGLPAPVARADAASSRMAADVHSLAAGGPREAGTAREAAAFDFVVARLQSLGLAVGGVDVPLPNGRTSRDRWTSFGSGPVEVLLTAHVDTVPVSPGADDDGSGVAVLLEYARALHDGSATVPAGTTVTLVWVGAEEWLAGRAANDHHFGSRLLAAQRAAAGRQPAWMLSVDMVGYGATPLAVYLDGAEATAAFLLSTAGSDAGAPASVTARGDISDHEAFARQGTPSAFLWRPDNPGYHSAGDTVVVEDRLSAALATTEAFVSTVADPRRSTRAMVNELYVDLLARRPDVGGVSGATTPVLRGQRTVGEAGAVLLASDEWAAGVAPIGRLYRAALGRDADHAGLFAWRASGWSLPAMAAFFVGSPEFAARYGAPDDGGFVDLLYANVLGRAADAGGRAYWVDQLGHGRSRADVLVGFSESTEHRARTAASLPVALAYAGLLRRPADPGGLAYWSGRPLADVVAGLVGSAEFRSRFG